MSCPMVMISGRHCDIAGWHLHYPAWVRDGDPRAMAMLLLWWPSRRPRRLAA